MPNPFFLYGSSPDVLAAQQGRYEQQFTSAADLNRNAAMRANEISLNAFLQNQSREDVLREMDARNRITAFFGQQDRADRAAGFAEDNRRFDSDQALKADTLRRQLDYDERYAKPKALLEMDLKREELRALKGYNPNALKQAEFSHKMAMGDADMGNIDSVEQAMKLYPGITPIQAENYVRQSQMARGKAEAELRQLGSAAKILTAFEQAKRNSEKAMQRKPAGGFLGIGTDRNEVASEQAKYAGEIASLQDIAEGLRKRGVADRLNFDPETGEYSVIEPNMPWRNRGGSPAPAFFGAPTSTGTTPAPQALNPPSTPAAMPAPSPKSVSNRFTIDPPSTPAAPQTTPIPVTPAALTVPEDVGRAPMVRRMTPLPPTPEPRQVELTAFGKPAITTPEFWTGLGSNIAGAGRAAGRALTEAGDSIYPRWEGQRTTYRPQEVSPEQNIAAPTMREILAAKAISKRRADLAEEIRNTSDLYKDYRDTLIREYMKLTAQVMEPNVYTSPRIDTP